MILLHLESYFVLQTLYKQTWVMTESALIFLPMSMSLSVCYTLHTKCNNCLKNLKWTKAGLRERALSPLETDFRFPQKNYFHSKWIPLTVNCSFRKEPNNFLMWQEYMQWCKNSHSVHPYLQFLCRYCK